MNRLVATVAYIGFLGPAPGTWASAAAVLAGWLLHWAGGIYLLALATLAVFPIGLYTIPVEMARSGLSDPVEVVIDEVGGQWLALWPLSIGLTVMGVSGAAFPWPGWVGAFVMFRLFDVWKPGPIGWANARGDAWGVLLDDTFAGLAAAVVVVVFAAVAHLVVMR